MKDAVAVVIKNQDRFLLIKRAKKGLAENYWCPVTGEVEPEETQEQAVIRETKEEIGIDVEPIRKVWECCTEEGTYRLHWWYVNALNNSMTINKREVKEYGWFTSNEMENMDKIFSADLFFFRKIVPYLRNTGKSIEE